MSRGGNIQGVVHLQNQKYVFKESLGNFNVTKLHDDVRDSLGAFVAMQTQFSIISEMEL